MSTVTCPFLKVVLTGMVGVTTGWGSVRFGGKGPRSLYEGAVVIYSHDECKKSLVGFHYYKQVMVCASSYPVDSCSVRLSCERNI